MVNNNMNRTYISPKTIVFGLEGQALICTSLTVNGQDKVSNSEDIGFVKDGGRSGNPVDWDENWE